MSVCSRCGRESADDASFCPGCGAPLETAPQREERKVVSVVYADLVGSTARAERLDPEDVRAVLAPYHARLRRELERFGGTVEKFIGDAVVSVFGAPLAHEDDAQRAVRAGLAVQDAIAELNEANPALELSVRVGVARGPALVAVGAHPEAGEAMVSGDVMNTGARLQAGAPPGGVLVGEVTYRATGRAIDYREVEPVRAKGKAEPLRAWLALAPRASFGVDVFQSGRAPLVGRAWEVELLAGALARARRGSEPQLVTLVGVPGIGKSRLVYELARLVDGDPELTVWRQGRSLPYGEGVAFWGLGEVVKAQAGILESDPAPSASVKLEAAVGDLLSEAGADAEWVKRHLRPLVGLGSDGDVSDEGRAEAFAAWYRFFEALAERSPAVVVFEDLHWADDGLLDFVDGLVERVAHVSLLVVCTARPELSERRPHWGGGKRNALTISLDPLSERETAELVSLLLDRPVATVEDEAVLLQRAGGNPLYAEEYARMLGTAGEAGAEVPETLQGIVAARIDALPGDEKDLLQLAAVLGKVFWTDVLGALVDVDDRTLDERLRALERKEFVRRERRSAVAGASQFTFVHALVRDGAYGQLPRASRSEAHGRVAAWIDSLPPDRAEDRAEMRAHHLVEAVDYGRAAGLDVAALLPQAAQAAAAAGDRAWALGAPAAALALYERSRALDSPAGGDPDLLLRLGRALAVVRGKGEEELERASAALARTDPSAAAEADVVRGEIVWQRGDQEGAFRYFEQALETVAELPASRRKLLAIGQVARFVSLAGRREEGLRLAGEAVAMAEELGDTELLADALTTRGTARLLLGGDGWLDDLEQSLALGLEAGSWRASRTYTNLGAALYYTATDLARAADVSREGVRFAERLGVRPWVRWCSANLADSLFQLGAWDEALRLADAELANPDPHYIQETCRWVRARIRLARGDTAGAIADAEGAAEQAHAIRDPQIVLPALGVRALCHCVAGDRDTALAAYEELERARGGLEEPPPGDWVVTLACAALELGREEDLIAHEASLGAPTPWREAALAIARGDLAGSADILAQVGAVAYEAHVRFCAVRRLAAAGRRSEAATQLTRAVSFYRSVGAAATVDRAEALLPPAS